MKKVQYNKQTNKETTKQSQSVASYTYCMNGGLSYWKPLTT